MELKDILGLSAMALFFGWIIIATLIGKTAQKKKVATFSLELNEKKSATYTVTETLPYDKIEWSLEKKQKTPRSKFDQTVGITRYENVRSNTPRKYAGKIAILANGKLILKDDMNFISVNHNENLYYADYVVDDKGVERGCLNIGDTISIEVSCIETPFDIEVYLCTSVKAKLLGYKQT